MYNSSQNKISLSHYLSLKMFSFDS